MIATDGLGSSIKQELAEEPLVGNYFVAAYPPFSAWASSGIPSFHDVLENVAPYEPIGLYVHLPFCQQKCDYCFFLSFIAQSAKMVDRYIDSLVREMELYAAMPSVRSRPISFAYFGGGTPSMLSAKQVQRLAVGLQRSHAWNKIEEITFECAPRSVRPELLESLREMGVTRLSMGVQSFDDKLLKMNGRVHSSQDVDRAYSMIRKANVGSVNLDLMCGLIGETGNQWRESTLRALELEPESISIYQTEIPHNTKLYRDLQNRTLPSAPIPWEIKRDRLAWAFDTLESAGYTVVSGYQAVRDPKRHRFLYQNYLWGGADLLGLGVAAFGYVGGVHVQNETTLEKYEAALDRGELPVKRANNLSPRDQVIRELILQLKLGCVSIGRFRERFGVEILKLFARPLQRFATEGWITISAEVVALTRQGLLRVDRLLPQFYDAHFVAS